MVNVSPDTLVVTPLAPWNENVLPKYSVVPVESSPTNVNPLLDIAEAEMVSVLPLNDVLIPLEPAICKVLPNPMLYVVDASSATPT